MLERKATNKLIISQTATYSDLAKSFILRAMFWRPAYLEESQFLEYIPFAFWIIEASRPKVFVDLGSGHCTSYFAHCQAVDKLGLDVKCYAVDTWVTMDPIAGEGNKKFERAKAYNDSHYSGFSHLMRSSYNDAARNFADDSIDLLQIDALHLAGFTLHDLEIWLPKLSKRAIILLHGTNSREQGFDVPKLFDQLKSCYPAFEFSFGQGLGLFVVGSEKNALIQLLLDANNNEHTKQSVQEVFFRLGRACTDSFALIQHKDNMQNLNKVLGQKDNQLSELRQSFETVQIDLSQRNDELKVVKDLMNSQIEQHAVERGQLSEKITSLQEMRSDLKNEVKEWQVRADNKEAGLSRCLEDLARLEQMNSSNCQNIDVLMQRLQERDTTITSLQKDEVINTSKIEVLLAELLELRSNKQQLVERNQQLDEVNTSLGREVLEFRHRVDEMEQKVVIQESIITVSNEQLQIHLTEQLQRLTELADLNRLLQSKEIAADELQVKLNAEIEAGVISNAETLELRNKLEIQYAELTDRAGIIEKLEQKNSDMQMTLLGIQESNNALVSNNEALNQKLETRFKELAQMTMQLIEFEGLFNNKNQQLEVIQKQALEWRNRSSWPIIRRAFHKADMYQVQKEQILLSGLFDTEWYLKQYPDVTRSQKDPVEHYLRFGAAENRDPSIIFCTAAYRAANRESLADGKNPLIHFIEQGLSCQSTETTDKES